MLDLFYRRPKHVKSFNTATIPEEDVERYMSRPSSNSSAEAINIAGIPGSLSFERIMQAGTCPPCTVRDFMDYMIHIERGSENLQFWLWHTDYEKRFQQLGERDKSLSPEWTKDIAASYVKAKSDKVMISTYVTKSDHEREGYDYEESSVTNTRDATTITSAHPSPLHTPPSSPPSRSDMSGYWDDPLTKTLEDKLPANYRQTALNAFKSVNDQWQPYSVQPFRDEVARIVTLYLVEGAPRELNLTSRDRHEVLCALQHTTHPSAFLNLKINVEWTLRNQSHPNFIRWAICNGNRPRVIFAKGLGVSLIFLGLMMASILTMTKADRGWRAFSAILLVIGIATLIAAWKGMCVVLHGLHIRQLHPWELFPSEDSELELDEDKKAIDELEMTGFESEPWIEKYEKRNFIRKIFDRQVWIQEPALRQIQDAIFLQSLLLATLITALIVGVFVALPKGRLF